MNSSCAGAARPSTEPPVRMIRTHVLSSGNNLAGTVLSSCRAMAPRGREGLDRLDRAACWRCSAALFEPCVLEQVVVGDQQCPIVEQQLVVLADDGVLAPPLVVDSPVVLDAGDAA